MKADNEITWPKSLPGIVVEVHSLTSYPLTVINRDFSGYPKSASYGGCDRVRISQQSRKRCIRESIRSGNVDGTKPDNFTDFTEKLFTAAKSSNCMDIIEASSRTKRAEVIADIIAGILIKSDPDEEKVNLVAKTVVNVLSKSMKEDKKEDKKKKKKDAGENDDDESVETVKEKHAPMYLTTSEIKVFASSICDKIDKIADFAKSDKNKKKAPKAKAEDEQEDKKSDKGNIINDIKNAWSKAVRPNLDVALHGRMQASNANMNIDSAITVGHSLTVHASNVEYDSFTLVDDMKDTSEDLGSSHLGYTPMACGTFYNYTAIDVRQLISNLVIDEHRPESVVNEFVTKALPTIIKSIVRYRPKTYVKRSSNQMDPAFVILTVRVGTQNVGLDDAFEKPVRAFNNNGYTDTAIKRLSTHWNASKRVFGDACQAWIVSISDLTGVTFDGVETLHEDGKPDLDVALEACANVVAKQLNAEKR